MIDDFTWIFRLLLKCFVNDNKKILSKPPGSLKMYKIDYKIDLTNITQNQNYILKSLTCVCANKGKLNDL